MDKVSESLQLTADIIVAYVSNNPVSQSDLVKLIGDVHRSILTTGAPEPEMKTPEAIELKPAVSVKKSVSPDFLICLEDGKRFKSLKRHLRTHYNLSPEQYREKWGLPSDYPMVAPSYAKARSNLAKQIGLGQKRTQN